MEGKRWLTVKLEPFRFDAAPDHGAEAAVPDRRRVGEVLRRGAEDHLERPRLFIRRPPGRRGNGLRLRRATYPDPLDAGVGAAIAVTVHGWGRGVQLEA